jgi:hypothetical protein
LRQAAGGRAQCQRTLAIAAFEQQAGNGEQGIGQGLVVAGIEGEAGEGEGRAIAPPVAADAVEGVVEGEAVGAGADQLQGMADGQAVFAALRAGAIPPGLFSGSRASQSAGAPGKGRRRLSTAEAGAPAASSTSWRCVSGAASRRCRVAIMRRLRLPGA